MKKFSPFFFLLLCSTGFAQNIRNWATYYGGTADDVITCVATDATGHVYIGGYTSSATGIAMDGFQNTIGSGSNPRDAFLVKFNAAGNRMWATYYGGTCDDQGRGVAIDPSGNVYFSGVTCSAGLASGGFQNVYAGGGDDAFLVKFDSTGNRLWATYYGGSGAESDAKIATDNAGNIFLCGYTASTSGIASGGFQNTYGGGVYDGYLVKFDGAGNRLWATYYGGSAYEECYAISTDPTGHVYIGGQTQSTSGMASGGFQTTYAGMSDGWIARFDAAGNRNWATYIGGNDFESVYDATADASGNVYAVGATESTSGVASGGVQNTYGGGSFDGFITKIDSSGNRLWSTYWGGPGEDYSFGSCIDPGGIFYMNGSTNSTSNIASNGFQNMNAGLEDAALVAYNNSGTIIGATYYGGADIDNAADVAADAVGNIYHACNTHNATGLAAGGFQNSFGGGFFDGLLVQFRSSAVSVSEQTAPAGISIYPNPTAGMFTITAQGEVRISNMLGEMICTQKLTADKTTIDLRDQAKGVYIIELRDGNHRAVQKLVLQ